MHALPSEAFRGDQRPARDDGVWISGERLRPNTADTISWEATTQLVPQLTLTRTSRSTSELRKTSLPEPWSDITDTRQDFPPFHSQPSGARRSEPSRGAACPK